MPIIIVILLGGLLFAFNVDSTVVETEDKTVDDTTTEEGTETDTETDIEEGDNPLVGNSYDLNIDNDPLPMTFEEDGTLTIPVEDFSGDYEITDDLLYVNVNSLAYNETVVLQLTYDDLSLDVVSGEVLSYEVLSPDSDLTEEESEEFNSRFTGLPYTLEKLIE